MSEELAGAIGELKGRLDTFMENQRVRDEVLNKRHEDVLAALTNVDKKAEAAHKRISRIHWVGYGVGAAVGGIGTAMKFLFNHGEQVVKTVETIDKLHPK